MPVGIEKCIAHDNGRHDRMGVDKTGYLFLLRFEQELVFLPRCARQVLRVGGERAQLGLQGGGAVVGTVQFIRRLRRSACADNIRGPRTRVRGCSPRDATALHAQLFAGTFIVAMTCEKRSSSKDSLRRGTVAHMENTEHNYMWHTHHRHTDDTNTIHARVAYTPQTQTQTQKLVTQHTQAMHTLTPCNSVISRARASACTCRASLAVSAACAASRKCSSSAMTRLRWPSSVCSCCTSPHSLSALAVSYLSHAKSQCYHAHRRAP